MGSRRVFMVFSIRGLDRFGLVDVLPKARLICQRRPRLVVFAVTLALVVASVLPLPAAPDAPPFADGDQQRLPDVIVEPTEILPGDQIPAGTFALNARGFVVTRGKRFAGEPPASNNWRIEYAGKSYSNAGLWNNETVTLLDRAGPRDRTQLEEAARRLQAGLKADPQFFPFLFNNGRALLMMNRPRDALRFLKRARGILPEFPATHSQIGRAHALLQEQQAVEQAFTTAARLNPFDPQPLVELGNYLLEEGATVKAAYYFRAVLRDHPDYSNARIGLARLVMQSGDVVRAHRLFSEVPTEFLDGTPRRDYDRILHYYLAEIAGRLQDYREAVGQLDRLLQEPTDPFFMTVPIQDIQRRRDILQRLADIQVGG